MSNFGFIGNRRIYEYFFQLKGDSQLSHAYGFAGINQVGKRTLATLAAAHLLGVEVDKLLAHPDFYYVERVLDEKTGKLKKDISAEQARGIKDILLRRSWLGGYQVVVIDEVEHLNPTSANSLLKFLEEPSGKTVIFIITQDEGKLLPTVRSRCQWWRFCPVGEEEVAKGLRASGISAENADEAAKLSWGRPGRAIDLATDAQKLARVKDEIFRYEKLRSAPVYERFKTIEGLAGEKKNAERGKDELDEILQIWIMAERQKMLSTDGIVKQKSIGIIDKLSRLRGYLAQNIHPRLALEEFSLNF